MLDATQVEEFFERGALVVDDMIPPDVLAEIEAEYSERIRTLYRQWEFEAKVPAAQNHWNFGDYIEQANDAGVEWYQPLDISLPAENISEATPLHVERGIFSLMTQARVLDALECLIGPEISSNPIQHVRIKPPQNRVSTDEVRAHIVATDWHQDRAVAHASADQTSMVTVWVAINDATEENGCLQVIEGPHQRMYPHCPKRQTAIADGFIDPAAARALPVKAGGVVLLHPLTPHCSLPNRSDDYRWSFDLRYNVTGQATGRDHFPSFVARSRSAPQSELRDWRTYRAMWHDARTRAANGPHIPQHRWQADSPACA